MKILAAWDDLEQVELLQLYLDVDEHQAVFTSSADDLMSRLQKEEWDVLLLALSFPENPESGLKVFLRVQEMIPELPIVVACRPTEMVALPRFLSRGLRHYLVRDAQADFLFLTMASLEAALAARKAEEARKLADHLREEMDGVRRLQESIIPHGLTAPPGYLFGARYEPSQVTSFGNQPVVMAGGDYYDLFRPDERTMVLLIGDAAGHGLKACMSIMTMHTLIRMITGDRYRDTGVFVAEINQKLCDNSIVQSGGGFITLFYAAIDTVAHTMTWTSAGHPLALLHRFETNEVVPVGTDADNGLPLGIVPGESYPSSTLEVPPDSQILLYTDGLTDAMAIDKPGHTQFGVNGIIDTLRSCQRGEPEKTVEKLFHASMSFTGGQGRHDDTSMVLLERKPVSGNGA